MYLEILPFDAFYEFWENVSILIYLRSSNHLMAIHYKHVMLCSVILLSVMPLIVPAAFGHGGNPGVDRAPPINFEDKNVTVKAKMNPSDMTVGDFTNTFLELQFVDVITEVHPTRISGMNCTDIEMDGMFECSRDVPFSQVTYLVGISKRGDLLARESFYAEDGILTVDIRPKNTCDEEPVYKCSNTYGVKHPIAGGLHAFGQNNPVIDGPIFTKGGLYHIEVEIIGAGSVRSNLLDPLEFDLYVSIAEEFTFYVDYPAGNT